jgi:hypothetical protein
MMLASRSVLLLGLFPLFAFGQVYWANPMRFAGCPKPNAPDYNIKSSWASLPDIDDPADQVPKGLKNNQAMASADVFFIHPTSYLGKPTDSFSWNADVANAAINKETDGGSIQYQASIFNESYRIFAPRYRQAHLYAFFTPYAADRKAALDLAYEDVRSAFLYYLQHYHSGRPILIAAHSQGTIHAHRLLREFVENKPLQELLVGAYLPGMPVSKDSFTLLMPCKDSTESGCWVSWRTWRYGTSPNPVDAVCHNPISWTLDTVPVSRKWHRGAVLWDFKRVRKRICDAQVNQNILWIHRPKFAASRLVKNPNYHVGDYNLFYMDVRTNATLRLNSYLQKRSNYGRSSGGQK